MLWALSKWIHVRGWNGAWYITSTQMFAATAAFPSALLWARSSHSHPTLPSTETDEESGHRARMQTSDCGHPKPSLFYVVISSINSKGNAHSSRNSVWQEFTLQDPTYVLSVHVPTYVIFRLLTKVSYCNVSSCASRLSSKQPELSPLFRILSVGRQPHWPCGDKFAH